MINVSFWNILWTVVNLLVLFIAFKIFFFKPIANILKKRQEEADEVLDSAAKKESEADEKAREYEKKLADAEDEKKRIMAEAKKNADSQYRKIISDAKEDARAIKDAAVAEANQEKSKIISSAKKEIADIVVDATSKVVASKTGTDIDSELFDEFLGKAGE